MTPGGRQMFEPFSPAAPGGKPDMLFKTTKSGGTATEIGAQTVLFRSMVPGDAASDGYGRRLQKWRDMRNHVVTFYKGLIAELEAEVTEARAERSLFSVNIKARIAALGITVRITTTTTTSLPFFHVFFLIMCL